MLHKDFSLELKAVSDAGIVEGYGSVFGGAPDSYGDIIAPGAFADSLAKHRREGTMPLMFFGHKSNDLTIGNWQDMAEDGKGLWVQGQLDMDDPFATKIHRKLKRKEMRGLSIGYETIASEEDPKRQGVRTLKAIDLWEVSVVNFPAQTRATVIAAKSRDILIKLRAGDRLTEREWETLLKGQHDFSNAEAERAVRINLKGQGELGGTAPSAVEFAERLRTALLG